METNYFISLSYEAHKLKILLGCKEHLIKI